MIMFTSFAPSPIARVFLPVFFFINLTNSAFYAGEDLYMITDSAPISKGIISLRSSGLEKHRFIVSPDTIN